MKKTTTFILALVVLLMAMGSLAIAKPKPIEVTPFNKIIVSPHVYLILTQGEEESVSIDTHGFDEDKVNVKVSNGTLRVYLKGAKVYTKSKKQGKGRRARRLQLYKGTMITARVTFRYLDKLSVRGEEEVFCAGPMKFDKLKLKMYGESELNMPEMNASVLKSKLYGRNQVNIEKGVVKKQKYSAYGENVVAVKDVQSLVTKSRSYGENDFNLNADKRVSVSSFGESAFVIHGKPRLTKGIVIGSNRIIEQ